MASTPRAFSSGISALTVPASSRNSRSATPTGETRPGVPFRVRPMKATGMPSNVADFVRRKHGLAAALLERAGGEIAKFRAGERMRPLALVDRVAAAILHAQQFVLALVEFVIADGGNIQAHHRQRLDRRLVMEHRRQKRAGADQVAGRDEDRVPVSLAKLADQRRHMFGAAGRDGDLLRLVLGIGNRDPARRRAKVAVKIVDRENAQVDGGGRLGVR